MTAILGSNTLLQWFKHGVRKLRISLRRSLSKDEWPAQSMPSFPMFYQNATTVNSFTPTMRDHKHQPTWSTKAYQGRSRTATARVSSGDVYPLHSILSHAEYDRGSSTSNLRRCLSLAENQNRDIGNDCTGHAAPFSMEAIPETEMQTSSSQNLGHSYLRRDSTLEQIFAWEQGAASMLSLNATPNVVSGVDRSPQLFPRNDFHNPPSLEPISNDVTFFEPQNKPLVNGVCNNYMTRSGRDSGFIDIPSSQQNFAQMDSSAYSVIHSHQPSESRTQEASDVKEITDAFEGLASDALKSSSLLELTPPPQIPTSSNLIHDLENWWATGISPFQQNQQEIQQQRNLNDDLCQNWNVYQNDIFSSKGGEVQPLQAK